MKKTSDFWNKAAAKYSRSPIKDMSAYDKTIDRVNEHINTDMVGLEIGCGTGTTALRLAGNIGQIHATDYASEMVEIGQQKAISQKIENVTFETATVGDMLEGNRTYDVVMAFNVLHLIEDVPQTAQQAHKLLKSGGLFISKSTCLSNGMLFQMLRPLFIVGRWVGLVPFINYFSTTKLENMISSEGFEIIERGDYPAKPPNHFVVARRI